jgi:hypothetical protein
MRRARKMWTQIAEEQAIIAIMGPVLLTPEKECYSVLIL